eukprot:TRINITY_DN1969_c1_g1_i1.p1 TRINITY_DN1969_c1_g1~~TRINITY_DN1969_c1_g1_i1.p1  ORF type:complete len:205 (-),score=43.67 TRINITY_DN1969_c1_g1_i1:410-1024(-)
MMRGSGGSVGSWGGAAAAAEQAEAWRRRCSAQVLGGTSHAPAASTSNLPLSPVRRRNVEVTNGAAPLVPLALMSTAASSCAFAPAAGVVVPRLAADRSLRACGAGTVPAGAAGLQHIEHRYPAPVAVPPVVLVLRACSGDHALLAAVVVRHTSATAPYQRRLLLQPACSLRYLPCMARWPALVCSSSSSSAHRHSSSAQGQALR